MIIGRVNRHHSFFFAGCSREGLTGMRVAPRTPDDLARERNCKFRKTISGPLPKGHRFG